MLAPGETFSRVAHHTGAGWPSEMGRFGEGAGPVSLAISRPQLPSSGTMRSYQLLIGCSIAGRAQGLRG